MVKSGCSYVKYLFDPENLKMKGFFAVDKPSTQEIKLDDKTFRTASVKELQISLKKKKFLFKKELIDKKKIKLKELASKCDMETVVKLGAYEITLSFKVNHPTKDKEME